MSQLMKQAGRPFTYADYCSWPEDERWEVIEGVAYDMSPAPARVHADLSMALLDQLLHFFREKPCRVYHAPFDVRFPNGKEPDDKVQTVVQPDILVVCDEKKLDDKGCRGAPDLVIEILSPSTASKDHIVKRCLYETHGVREYWIVDPINRLVTIYSRNPEGRFEAPAIHADPEKVKLGLFPELEIDLEKVFPPKPPRVVKESPARYL